MQSLQLDGLDFEVQRMSRCQFAVTSVTHSFASAHTNMSSETLPIDLIDHILSFLRSDLDTLKICAQTHPILSDLSERYIYAVVILHHDSDYFPRATPDVTNLWTRDFVQILVNKSTIANHVRCLEVFCGSEDPDPKQHEMRCSHFDSVASLLPMLTGLTRLMIRGRPMLALNPCFSWHAMTETFRQAFLHQLQLRDIVVRYISFFPMASLNDRRNVRLSLEYCEETQYDGNSQSYQVPFDHISIIGCSEMCLDSIASCVKSHGLRSLKCSPYLFTNSFRQLLDACSNSLTNLYLLDSGCTSSIAYLFHSNLADVHRILSGDVSTSYEITNHSAIHNWHENGLHLPFTLANLHHLTQLTIDTNPQLFHSDQTSWILISQIPNIAELIYTARPTLKRVSIMYNFLFFGDFECLPDSSVIWFPFIPLAARCSSASMSLYISPSFCVCDSKKLYPPNLFSSLGDYKGLTPYVQSGVVVISEDFLKNDYLQRVALNL